MCFKDLTIRHSNSIETRIQAVNTSKHPSAIHLNAARLTSVSSKDDIGAQASSLNDTPNPNAIHHPIHPPRIFPTIRLRNLEPRSKHTIRTSKLSAPIPYLHMKAQDRQVPGDLYLPNAVTDPPLAVVCPWALRRDRQVPPSYHAHYTIHQLPFPPHVAECLRHGWLGAVSPAPCLLAA